MTFFTFRMQDHMHVLKILPFISAYSSDCHF